EQDETDFLEHHGSMAARRRSGAMVNLCGEAVGARRWSPPLEPAVGARRWSPPLEPAIAGDRSVLDAPAHARFERGDSHPSFADRLASRPQWRAPTHRQLLIGRLRLWLTRSLRSLPGLKCGTYLPASATASPVF